MSEAPESRQQRERRFMLTALQRIADRVCECHPDKECAPCIAFDAINTIEKKCSDCGGPDARLIIRRWHPGILKNTEPRPDERVWLCAGCFATRKGE